MNEWGITRELLRQAWRLVVQRRAVLLAGATIIGLVALLLVPYDHQWHHLLTADRPEARVQFAKQVSHWGDYPIGTVLWAAIIWLVGWWRKQSRWRMAALACFLGGSLAGAEVNLIRLTVGRPRPRAELPDGLYGPKFNSRYHSFPSAHAGTSFGTASALAVALPAVGLPALAGATGVVWSRMYLREHYPSDIWVGSWIGLLTGLFLGLAARRCWRDATLLSAPGSVTQQKENDDPTRD